MAQETIEDLIDQLISVGRQAVGMGLVLASGGNLSARVPGGIEFAVTGTGTFLDELRHSDFSVMDLDGHVLRGCPDPSSEWKLHQRTYRVRPDVTAIIHLHPQYAVQIDAIGEEIRFFTLDHAAYLESVGRTDYYPNGSDELADKAAEQTVANNCVVLGHHGCSTVGDSVAMAFRRAMNLEQAAEATYRALVLGDRTTRFPDDELARLRARHTQNV